jgi:hypothetical protein
METMLSRNVPSEVNLKPQGTDTPMGQGERKAAQH